MAWLQEFEKWLVVATKEGAKPLKARRDDLPESSSTAIALPVEASKAKLEERIRIRIIDIEALSPIWVCRRAAAAMCALTLRQPICYDGEEFANNFGRLLIMPQVVQQLAAAILYRISSYFQIPMDPRRAILDRTFLALFMSWKDDDDFDNKLRRYVGVSKREGLPILYALTDSRDDLDYLWDRSYPRNTVWKKWFVTPEELDILEKLPSHTRALLDYMIAERATYFFGLDTSILSWTIAASRKRAGRLTATCPEFATKLPKGAAFVDNWSELYGSLECNEEMATAVWP